MAKKTKTEPTKVRALEDINLEYNNQCAIAGQLQFFVMTNQESLAQTNMKIRALNQEAQALQQQKEQNGQA